MALQRLHNETWGFDSNCFVCEPRNHMGLQLPFLHDDERHLVVTEFTLGADYSGAPSLVHGGVTLAILDEAQSWATIAVGGKFAVTTQTTSRFHAPIRLGKTYRVEARITDQQSDTIATAATIVDERGKLRVESEAVFAVLTDAIAASAIGAELNESDRTYLKD
jgi:acyl-coenzyme A thioesterase PaaI-like protein